jgi:hypothetical protein
MLVPWVKALLSAVRGLAAALASAPVKVIVNTPVEPPEPVTATSAVSIAGRATSAFLTSSALALCAMALVVCPS